MPHEQLITDCIDRFAREPGGLLPLLHAIQDIAGFIPAETIAPIAEALNLSRAEVHGVISFYHDFRTEPGGTHRIQVCRAEACQAMGGRELEAHARDAIADDVTLEPVYCLGNCACSPAVMVDGKTYGRVSKERFDEIVAGLGGKRA